ncbi:MAG: IclR family transcriptional regulator [Clostridia bacterium]|nr:IclR family transcriptional regulator [Clostridia bacterium]
MEGKLDSVQSVDRVLDIIEVLSTEQDGLGVTTIAKKVGLHKSTAHRLLTTLANRGYVAKTGEGNYKIGLKLIEAVSCYINSLELQTEARPYLMQLTGELGLTSHLGILDRDMVVYIEKMDVVSSIRMYSQIGLRMHSYCSSLGKCLLSNYSKEELNGIMKDCSFIKFTNNTIGSMEELHKEINKVRKQGWAMDNEEYEIGHRCIGAPIYDYKGDIIAAISASGPKNLIKDDRIQEVANAVKKAALELSRSMGYIPE